MSNLHRMNSPILLSALSVLLTVIAGIFIACGENTDLQSKQGAESSTEVL